MSESDSFALPIYIMSGVFGVAFIAGPIGVRFMKSPNQGIIQCCIMLSCFVMWIFWLVVYMAQINPLIGPRLDNTTLAWMAVVWGDKAM